MPTYEYQCNTCGHHFEKFQRFSDDPLTECPNCAAAIRRVIHSSGIIFKGSGWYITDSRKSSSEGESNGKSEKSEKSATPAADGDAAKSSKPAEKTAAASDS